MKKSLWLSILALFLFFVPARAVEIMNIPTGLMQWDKSAAYDGYTLLSPNLSTFTYLLDMEGNVVHSWETAGRPGMYAELLPNGNLLRGYRLDKVVPFGGVSGVIQELDWDGKVVWEKKIHSPTDVTHHAFDRMPNGNTLIVCWGYKTYEDAMAKGRKEGTIPKKGEGTGEALPTMASGKTISWRSTPRAKKCGPGIPGIISAPARISWTSTTPCPSTITTAIPTGCTSTPYATSPKPTSYSWCPAIWAKCT